MYAAYKMSKLVCTASHTGLSARGWFTASQMNDIVILWSRLVGINSRCFTMQDRKQLNLIWCVVVINASRLYMQTIFNSIQKLLQIDRIKNVVLDYMWRQESMIWHHLVTKNQIDLDKFHSIKFCCRRYYFQRHHYQRHYHCCRLIPCTCKRLVQVLSKYVPTLYCIQNSSPRKLFHFVFRRLLTYLTYLTCEY